MKNIPLATVSAPVHRSKIETPVESLLSKPCQESGISSSPMGPTKPVGARDRILLLIEQPPWSALYRMMLGVVMTPLFSHLSEGNTSELWFVVWFVGTLFALRLVPAVLRKVLPFSSEVKTAWLERRKLAKTFDSYQWQKLFWLGIGLAGYVAVSKDFSGAVGVVTGFCLISGGLGLLMWCRQDCDSREQPARGSSR